VHLGQPIAIVVFSVLSGHGSGFQRIRSYGGSSVSSDVRDDGGCLGEIVCALSLCAMNYDRVAPAVARLASIMGDEFDRVEIRARESGGLALIALAIGRSWFLRRKPDGD